MAIALQKVKRYPQKLIQSHLHFDHASLVFASTQKSRVVFGDGCVKKVSETLATLPQWRKTLVVIGQSEQSAKRAEYIFHLLQKANIQAFSCTITGDSATTENINAARDVASRVGADSVVALGGGKVMDAARAISVLLTNKGKAEDFLWGNSKHGKMRCDNPPAPHVVIPTIFGSGAELSTKSYVLDRKDEEKLLFVDIPIEAEAVFIDPKFSLSVSPHAVLQGALTTAGQCIESYLLNVDDNDEISRLSMEGFIAVLQCFQTKNESKVDLKNIALHQNLAFASLCSSAASAKYGLGMAHSFYLGWSGTRPEPYRVVCSSYLPSILKHYASLFEENNNNSEKDFNAMIDTLNERYNRLVNELVQRYDHMEKLEDWFSYLFRNYQIPRLLHPPLEDNKQLVETILAKNEDPRLDNFFMEKDIVKILQSNNIV